MCSYRDRPDAFAALDATVVGISAQDLDSRQGFIEKNSLTVPLLADVDKQVAKAYSAVGRMGTKRAVIVIDEDGIVRPLISIEFKVRGGELFTKFAETEEGAILVNASRGGQMTVEKLVDGVRVTDDIDYDHDIVRRWWFKSRAIPLYVDTQVAGGHPITAETGVRLDAIASRHRDGYSNGEISEDTGATETEVVAAILAARSPSFVSRTM